MSLKRCISTFVQFASIASIAFAAHAAPPPKASAAEQAAKKRDLADLRARIRRLTTGLNQKMASRREARDALRDSERAISDANRALAELESERQALQYDSDALEAREKALEMRLAKQQAALGRVLAARHESGAPDALRLVLSGQDPAEVTRKLYYLSRVSRAVAGLVEQFRAGLVDLAQVRAQTRQKAARLAEVEKAQRADRERIVAKALHRPAIFPVPPFALRPVLGESADALLLSSPRVKPDRLL